jgi:agmatinase
MPDQTQHPWDFLGLDGESAARERARAWVMPIPYEATTSYGAGTRNGPSAIIEASRQVELFDRELDREPVGEIGFFTMNPLSPVHTSPDAMIDEIERMVGETLLGTPSPELLIALGGEHSISSGIVRGLVKKCTAEDLVAVQIDAHADLRDQFEGSRHSHACAAKRILDVCPVFQIGIRNISESEERFRASCERVTTFFDEDVRADAKGMMDALGRFVSGKNVFLTIDLDGLDPAIMPAVGTPEPGGLDWYTTLDVARTIAREAASVPAFDIVELAPIPGMIGPDFLAAKLAYRIASLILLESGHATR